MRCRRLAPLAAAALLAACGSGPSDAELDRWLAEARAANEEAARAHGRAGEREGWTLRISGRVARPVTLDWDAIQAMTPTRFSSRSHPEDALRAQHACAWRGVRIDALVDRAGPAEDAREVTLLASDGFRATVLLEDARRYPIVLAYEIDGQPIERDAGGPLFAAFPIDDHPELTRRYDGGYWVFYVTHLIVDTEEPSLRVGDRTLGPAELEALPRAALVETVGYRVLWPSDAVRIEGPRVRDVLAAAGVALAPGEHVRVLSHAAISRGDVRPTRLRAEDVLGEDVILATRSGEARQPIPARMGGPIALGFPASVGARLDSHDWLTFVDGLEVER